MPIRQRILVTIGLTAVVGAACWVFANRHVDIDGEAKATGSLSTSRSSISIRNTLVGKVKSTSDQPIVRARVCASGLNARNRLERSCVVSAADGSYRLGLVAGDYSIIAAAENFDTKASEVSVLPERSRLQLDFVLAPVESTLEGIVLSATGLPIRDANVDVYRAPQDTTRFANAATDANGRFSLGASKGPAMLKVSARGYRDAQIQSFLPALDVEVTLYPGYPLRGTVVNEQTMQPLAAVTLAATMMDGADEWNSRSVATDGKGHFEIDGLPPGRVSLRVVEPNLWGRATADILPESETNDVTLYVRSVARVSGIFLSQDDGKPCAAGTLELVPEELIDAAGNWDRTAVAKSAVEGGDGNSGRRAAVLSAPVGQRGTVELLAVPAGNYRLAPNCLEHWAMGGPGRLTIATEDVTNLVWKFQQGATLAVRVTDESDRPIPAAQVTLQPIASRPFSIGEAKHDWEAVAPRSGQTDVSGIYKFGKLRPGSYEASARADGQSVGNSGSTASRKIVNVQAGVATEPLTLKLAALGSIRIFAHTPNAKPISRLLFFARDTQGRRFEARFVGEGVFALNSLPRGEYRVFAYDNKNEKVRVRVGSDETIRIERNETVRLDFEHELPNGSIEGVVIDAHGKPAAAALQAVSATLDDEDEQYSTMQSHLQSEQSRMTDAEGRFKIDGLDPNGSYRLFAVGRQGQKLERKNVSVGQAVQLTLPELATIAGSVTDARGRPLDAFVVSAENLDSSDQSNQEFKSADGHFAFSGVNPGNLEITAMSVDAHRQGTIRVHLAAGESKNDLRIVVTDSGDGDVKE